MARPPSPRLQQIERELRERLRQDPHTPGVRFYSNRALARAFGISQQSAHAILDRLRQEGLIVRKTASGSYLPESAENTPSRVRLIFNPRARRRDSFGRHLLQLLTARLESEGISFSTRFSDSTAPYRPASDLFPVFWEVAESRLAPWRPGFFGLILHREPPLGLAASWLDSILVDDRSGGVMAAQILRDRFGVRESTVIIGGPARDTRSRSRIDGFKTVFPDAQVCHAEGWFRRNGEAIASRVLRAESRGIFCCNDRLAEGISHYSARHGITPPPLIGFDNAPVAAGLNLNTIAIPWDGMVDAALDIIRRRIQGDRRTASQRILTPRPVLRSLLPAN